MVNINWYFQTFLIRYNFNMKKNLQRSLLVSLLIFSCIISKAQSDRVKMIKTDSKSDIKVEVVYPKMDEQKTKNLQLSNDPTLTKSKDISKQENKDALISNISKKKVDIDVKKSSALRKSKTAEQLEDNDDSAEKKKNVEAPLFPDFQVTATKEEPYENKMQSKESNSQQLVKLERVPADDSNASSTSPVDQNQVTISPLKRKYLEGVVADLEKEIQSKKNSLVEIKAKKKELDDLRKLLAQ